MPLTHFIESRQAEDQNWSVCQDGYDIMLFANRRGVVTFNGYDWDLIRLPVIPYTMVYDSIAERVYLGGDGKLGYLNRNTKGIYEYIDIKTDPLFSGVVTGILITDSLMYIMTPACIAIHRLPGLEPADIIHGENNDSFTAIFEVAGNIFINVWSKGLCRLVGKKPEPLITAFMTAYDDVLFVLPYDRNRVLVGLGSNSMHLFDGLEFYGWEPDDKGYIQQSLLAGGHVINDTLYLFSTLEGGVVVAGSRSRKVYYIINYESGLPDDEVYATGSDNNAGLWISHEFGLTRADISLPVRNFSVYPGLKGNLISSLWHNDRLYVGTSDGLYLLKEVRKYDTVLVKRKIKVVMRPDTGKQTLEPAAGPDVNVAAEIVTELPQRRRNIFDRIFGKKLTFDADTVKKKVDEMVPVAETVPEPQRKSDVLPLPSYRYVSRPVPVLRSVNHEYEKVKGIDDKCKQLVSTPGGILAATNRGLYCVNDSLVIPIVEGRYINRIGAPLENGDYYIAANNGYFSVNVSSGKWKVFNPYPGINRSFYSVAADADGNVWLGTESSLVRVSNDKPGGTAKAEYLMASDFIQRYHVEYIRDTLFVLTESGVYWYNPSADSLAMIVNRPYPGGESFKYILTDNSGPWLLMEHGFVNIGSGPGWREEEQPLLRLFDGITSISSSGSTLWITDSGNRLFRVETDKTIPVNGRLELFIGGVTADSIPFFDLERIDFKRGLSLVNLKLVSPYYMNQNAVQYRYSLSGGTNGWTGWSSSPSLSLLVKPGNYTLTVMARAATGVVSDIRSLNFHIRPRITETGWFYFVVGFFFLAALFIIMRMREKKHIKAKELLEFKVMERTAEIAAQKQEITSSIEYASRIQLAMLPDSELFRETFSEYFIFFHPRDIVSGDFYWIARAGGRVFFTVADCTGHGVPGAFMSMLGISSLNEIINSDKVISASDVLNQLRVRIKLSLKQTGRQGEAADGIDMALCIYDKDTDVIEFAAAYNSLIHFRGARITEYRGDRMPIGIFYGQEEAFTNHVFKLEKGDVFYLFSDGFTDQFGGPDQAKYKLKNLKLFLASVKDLPMSDQQTIIGSEFNRWRGDQDQVDDVTILGFRI